MKSSKSTLIIRKNNMIVPVPFKNFAKIYKLSYYRLETDWEFLKKIVNECSFESL